MVYLLVQDVQVSWEKDPPDPNSQSPSTGVLENVVKVEVKKLCTVATAVSNLIWRRLEYDEEALELMMTTAKSYTVSETKPGRVTIAETKDNEVSCSNSISSSTASQTTVLTVNQDNLKVANYESKTSFVHNKEQQMQSKIIVLNRPDIGPKEMFKRVVKLRQMDALCEHLESSWSLYLTNTGGQIEFQELLPLLVCGPSVFFVTFPLDKNLEDHYTVEYQNPNGRIKTYPSSSTLMDEILQTLATISALDHTGYNGPHDNANLKSKVFFVGTHKDKLSEPLREEIIEKIDKQLQENIRQTSLFNQGSIEFASSMEQLIFTVNNFAEDDEDFQKIRSALQLTVERTKGFTVRSPSTWLIFSLILRARYMSSQIMSYNKCFTVAQNCGITDRAELNNALLFIHYRLGLVRYFSTDALNTLVVIDPQVLFDKITDLIAKTFVSDHAEVNEIEEFQKQGIFSTTVMERISEKSHSNTKLPFAWLLQLLNHLRIIACFKDQKGNKKYFFPSVLCHAPKQPPTQHISSLHQPSVLPPPLLVAFESGFCPRGIPSALIKYLMTNEMKSRISWELYTSRIFRNQVSFGIGMYGDIILRIFPTHLEMTFDPESGPSDIGTTCSEAYKQIKLGMKCVTEQYQECEYFFAFYCTNCINHPHPAKVEWHKNKPSKLKCKVIERRSHLPKNYEMWNAQKRIATQQGTAMVIYDLS